MLRFRFASLAEVRELAGILGEAAREGLRAVLVRLIAPLINAEQFEEIE